MGPSRKDHFGLPWFLSTSLRKASISSQKARILRSWAGRSMEVSTFSNIGSQGSGVGGQGSATDRQSHKVRRGLRRGQETALSDHCMAEGRRVGTQGAASSQELADL